MGRFLGTLITRINIYSSSKTQIIHEKTMEVNKKLNADHGAGLWMNGKSRQRWSRMAHEIRMTNSQRSVFSEPAAYVNLWPQDDEPEEITFNEDELKFNGKLTFGMWST